MAEFSPSKPINPGDSYIGSVISLISKYEIRYEGVLYHLNIRDSTIGLKNVRSYGTEGRRNDEPQIPPSEKLYEFILFRGSDIKDLRIKSSSPPLREEQFHNDPAIIQSHYAGDPLGSSPSTSVGSKIKLTQGQNTPEWLNTPCLTSRAYSAILAPYGSATHAGLTNLSQDTQNAGPSYTTPIYQHEYNGTSVAASHAPLNSSQFQIPSMESSPLPVQSQMQASGIWNSPRVEPTNASESPILGLTNGSVPITPVPPIASNPLDPKISPSLSPVKFSTSPDILSTTSSIKTSPQFHAAGFTANKLTTSSIPWYSQGTSTTEVRTVAKALSDPVGVHSNQSMPHPASTFVGSTSSSSLTPLPSLLSPERLAQSRPLALSSAQNVYPKENGMAIMTTLSSTSPPLLPTPAAQGLLTSSPLLSTPASQGLLTASPPLLSTLASQEPLLPLPTSVQQDNFPTTQFTEEFDFQVMNEKFKKDEVWGYLGKAMQRDTTDGIDYSAIDRRMEDKERPYLPAYKKDDFFDTISCNSLARGRNGLHRFCERMKLDAETFGNSHQRSHLSYYGGYGAGRGNMYQGSCNWGSAYGNGGRGHGNTPF